MMNISIIIYPHEKQLQYNIKNHLQQQIYKTGAPYNKKRCPAITAFPALITPATSQGMPTFNLIN